MKWCGIDSEFAKFNLAICKVTVSWYCTLKDIENRIIMDGI